MSQLSRPRVLSGIQPSGHLHLGNYLGALRNWVRDQDRYENFFCIVDLHALTVPQEPEALREAVLELAAIYIAAGLDPDRCQIFVQSQIPAHTQLGWLIECMTPMGWLERMTQFKAKSQGQQRERVGTGLLTYPALMAADIVLYEADYVPVGDDQRQHVEYCRDIVQRFNSRYGEDLLTVPATLTPPAGARIMGLDDPSSKMSKSLALRSPGHAVYLLDSPDVVRKKVMRAKTDAKPAVEPPLDPGVANLVEIYGACQDFSPEAALVELTGLQYGALKNRVVEAVVSRLEPLQERFRSLRDDPAELTRVLERSADAVRPIADATLHRVQQAVGLR